MWLGAQHKNVTLEQTSGEWRSHQILKSYLGGSVADIFLHVWREDIPQKQ